MLPPLSLQALHALRITTMTNDVYQQALAEMEIPVSRIQGWVEFMQAGCMGPLSGVHAEHFDRIVRSVWQLIERMPEVAQRTDDSGRDFAFHHDLGGPIMQITGYAEIILSDLRNHRDADSIMCAEYLDDIRAAGDYLAALARNAQIDLVAGRK
jgi:hypothetical protein